MIHRLRSGFAVCGQGQPGQWPKGDTWDPDPRNTTCPGCRESERVIGQEPMVRRLVRIGNGDGRVGPPQWVDMTAEQSALLDKSHKGGAVGFSMSCAQPTGKPHDAKTDQHIDTKGQDE